LLISKSLNKIDPHWRRAMKNIRRQQSQCVRRYLGGHYMLFVIYGMFVMR